MTKTTFLVIQEPSAEQKREEQQKYGIFFDDEYDYLQHLKDSNEVYELEEHVPREDKVIHDGMSVILIYVYINKINNSKLTLLLIWTGIGTQLFSQKFGIFNITNK